jgi:ATP-dependent exoDNAse (exonuclease V) beta subunit
MTFTIYQASAGSGKTFSLAKEYLKIGLSNPEAYKNILAITFTNKAAAEMKDRILSYLTDLDGGDVNSKGFTEILPAVLRELDIPKEAALKNASLLLKKIIYNYADFSIITIDAFFQRILRTFAYDLDIPLNFQLEIDNKDIIERVVELLIDQVGENQNLTQMMIDFVNASADGSKSWHIEKEIQNFTPELFREQSKLFIDALQHLSLDDFTKIIHNFNAEKAELKKKFKEDMTSMKSLLDRQEIQIDNFSSKFLSNWFNSIEKEEYKIGKTLMKAISEGSWFPKKNVREQAAFVAIEVEFTAMLKQNIEDVKRLLFITAIQKRIFPMALLNELKRMLYQVESLEHTFQISNTNFKINEITSQEPTPYIYERLGDKYFYYFIDEFQDTSLMQWLNMLPLICEALSAYHDIGKGKAILFGDPKQAIYRFRGGDVEHFVSLPKIPNLQHNPIISQMESTLENQFNTINLGTNYRSYGNIVTFNNKFFQHLVNTYPKLAPLYKDHEQESIPSKRGGWVTITQFKKFEDLKYPEFALSHILKHIEAAIRDGFRYKDIAVLTRDKVHAPEIAAFLSNRKIPVVSSESLLVSSSLKVLFVMTALRYHFQNTNLVLAYSLLHKFYQLFKPESISEIPLTTLNFSVLEKIFGENHFNFTFHQLDSLNLYEKAELIIREFQLDAPADIYVLTFLNILNDKSSLLSQEQKFWDWWDDKQNTISVEMPDDIDGVTLLTIHKSKGLEYPVVIFPDYKTNTRKEDLWVNLTEKSSDKNQLLSVAKLPPQESEETEFSEEISSELTKIMIDKSNILYVALTRAIERLHIIIDKPAANPTTFTYSNSIADFTSIFEPFTKEESLFSVEFTFGDAEQKRASSRSSETGMAAISKLHSTDWKQNQRISAEFDNTEEQLLGTIFHFTMANIRSISDIREALEYTQKAYHIDQELLETLENMIRLVTNHPVLRPLFAENLKVLNEVEVIDSRGEVFRPDRVVEIDGKITILDFKTGLPSTYHSEQVQTYKNLYHDLGFKAVEGCIVYVNNQSIHSESV